MSLEGFDCECLVALVVVLFKVIIVIVLGLLLLDFCNGNALKLIIPVLLNRLLFWLNMFLLLVLVVDLLLSIDFPLYDTLLETPDTDHVLVVVRPFDPGYVAGVPFVYVEELLGHAGRVLE